jgi:glycosyltransferase involved in cell wall biosynthesis
VRFLIVIRKLTMGGIQKASVELAQALMAEGHEVHFFIQKGEPKITVPSGVIVHCADLDRLSRKTVWGFFYNIISRIFLRLIVPGSDFVWSSAIYTRYFEKFLKSKELEYGKFDYIIARGQGAFASFCRIDDDRLYYMVEGNPSTMEKNFFAGFLYRRLFSNKNIICVSSGIREVLRESLERHKVPLKVNPRVIYNVLDPQEINILAQENVSESLDFPYIVHVGRLHKAKNQELLLRAFAEVHSKVKLVIVGDGPKRKELEKLATKLHIAEKVVFVGNKQNPYPYIKKAKALVLTSPMEGLGLVLIEALMLGVNPIACAGRGGINEIMCNDLADNLSNFNPTNLAQKIDEIVETPKIIKPNMYQLFTAKPIVKAFATLKESSEHMN